MAVVSSKSFGTKNCFKETEYCYSYLCKIPTDNISHHNQLVMDPFSDHDVKMAFPLDEDEDHQKLPRVFSRLLKGLFSQSSTNSTRKKRKGEETSPSPPPLTLSDDVSTRIKKTFKLKKKKEKASSNTKFEGSSSNSSSHFTSSSLSSNSRSVSERKTLDLEESNMMMKTTKPTTKYGDYNCNLGLYFIFICLVGLVFCGKAFAICFTATSLLLFPTRTSSSRSQLNHLHLDFDFEPDMINMPKNLTTKPKC